MARKQSCPTDWWIKCWFFFFRGVKFISFCHPEVWRLVAQPQNRINSCEAVRVGLGGRLQLRGVTCQLSPATAIFNSCSSTPGVDLDWTYGKNKQGNKTSYLPCYLLSGLLQTVSTEPCRGFFLSGSCNILSVLSTGGACQHTGEWPIRPWPFLFPQGLRKASQHWSHRPVFKGPTILESKRSTNMRIWSQNILNRHIK